MNLYDCLTLPDNHNWGDRVDTPDGPYYFRDNGARVLGVAHLDTVMMARPLKRGSFVFAPQLDDRLGVWCLLTELPRFGITLDILLTTGEESCRSTAAHFQGKDYNWIVEFDRAGDDVVFYQYEDFEPYWDVPADNGSFSDIAVMDHLGVMCANLGIGYHNQHTLSCYADLTETRQQLLAFTAFYDKYSTTRFPYSVAKPRRKRRKRAGRLDERELIELAMDDRLTRAEWEDNHWDIPPEQREVWARYVESYS